MSNNKSIKNSIISEQKSKSSIPGSKNNLIKNIKNKNMNEIIAITILIIYFMNKEHSNLLSELLMIIKKAKQYILKETKDNYDNIIKEIGLN